MQQQINNNDAKAPIRQDIYCLMQLCESTYAESTGIPGTEPNFKPVLSERQMGDVVNIIMKKVKQL